MKVFLQVLVLMGAASYSFAAQPAAAPTKSDTKSAKVLSVQETDLLNSAGIIQSHPDLLHFRNGVLNYQGGRHAKARRDFHLAGLYGEKIAQAMLAEMYWKGEGGPVDRPRAYTMMDIAAERGTNPDLLFIRDKYWDELTAQEREQVAAIGDEIVAKFSDESALKKLAISFRTDKLSRIRVPPGRLQTLLIHGDMSSSSMDDDGVINADAVDPRTFYASKFWEPKEYMRMRDEITNRTLRNGRVRVLFGGQVIEQPKPVKADSDD